MKRVQSPWRDGIPPELYLTFWDIFFKPLLDMINTAIDKSAFNSNSNTAIITVIPRPNKDLTKCGNHRPLSLLNGDVKLYTKALASRLEIHITKPIHPLALFYCWMLKKLLPSWNGNIFGSNWTNPS